MSNQITLAKLTPPRLHAVTRRERLFTLLKEHHRQHPLIWVTGPPGAGKTSLVASYLAERKQRTLWYHVDAGDADLATFFHYFAQVAQAAAGRRRLRLPVLTPEFMSDLPRFTRRFLRKLWAKVPVPATVVLDNYQDLPAEAMLHTVLPIALAEFPVGATLVMISREDACTDWSQGVTQPQIGHIRWDDLQLTLEETQALAASVPGLGQAALEAIRAQTKGWVAGTVLMLERLKSSEICTALNSSETHTSFFAYFAQEVFARLEDRTKTVLLRTALLPCMTGRMADEVSGHPGAERVLRELYERGLFVDRRVEAQVTYHYHDLFRAFLVDHCSRQCGEDERHDLKRTAAGVAERAGQQDTAVALYAETKSWDDLGRLICEISPILLSQGRYQTLQGYIALLPPTERRARPWLLYWSGMSRLVFNPLAARTDFELAYHLFESADQDHAGLLLTCSGIIESHYCEVADMTPTILWGDRLRRLLQRNKEMSSPNLEATVLARLNGLMLACPHHLLLADIYNRIDQVLTLLENPEAVIGVATVFTILALWKGDLSIAQLIASRVMARTQEAALSDLSRLTWKVSEANYAWNVGEWEQVKLKIQEAHALADRTGIALFKPMIWGTQTMGRLTEGDHAGAESSANLLHAVTHASQRLAQGQCSFYRAGSALMRGDLQAAHQHATQAVTTTAPLGIPFLLGNCRVGLAKILIELGQFEVAREHLTESVESARIIRSVITEIHCCLTMAQLSIKEGHAAEAERSLREGLQKAREGNHLCLDYWWRPRVMAELLAYALEAGIEVDYVRSVIRRRNLRAPSAVLKHWPYPIKIATLGRFDIVIDGAPLPITGKAQRKPLELLKYLCAAGTQGVLQDIIEEVLWPEGDGEAAGQAFRTTLHRLRRLLCHDDAVQVSDRHVSLDMSLVSMRHLAFEHMAQDADRTETVAVERALALYGGHFLQGETTSWVLPVRERLRALFLDLTERLGAILEEQGKVNEATQKYLHALEVEPVAEVMCRRVMMTYVRLGRRSEAIGVYQRFSQALHIKLGVPPTLETTSLYHAIAKP